MDKVVHFEIPVDDAARAKEFYRSIFDWQLDDMDMGGGNIYTTVTTTPIDEQSRIPTDPGAINGGLMQRSPDTPAPVITIGVAAIDDALKKIEADGGSVVSPGPRSPTWGPSRTSKTPRATWSDCGKPSEPQDGVSPRAGIEAARRGSSG